MKIKRIVGRIHAVNAADSQFQIGRENISQEHHSIADLPAVLGRKSLVHQAACAVLLPCLHLFGRHNLVSCHLHVLAGIGGELREEIFRAIVFILAAEPGHRHDVRHAWQHADFVPVISRQEKRK